jgi:hypothetical protein
MPSNEAPIVTLYRGFLFYSVLTEAGAALQLFFLYLILEKPLRNIQTVTGIF